MERKSQKFNIIAAIITIPLFTMFLLGYSFIIFENRNGLSDIKYYSLLGLGIIGVIMWLRISVNMIKEIRKNSQ